eukprot:gene7932-8004_t
MLGLAFAACRQPHRRDTKKHWAYYEKAYGFLNTHTDSAFYYFNKAALDTADKLQVALAYYAMALIQADAGDDYGAQESLTLSLKSLDGHDAKSRQYLAADYNKLGMTFSNLKEYSQALTYYKTALQNTSDPQLRSYFLNNKGNAYKDLKNYKKALDDYATVVGIVGKTGSSYARVLTNIAVAKWLQNPRYDAAPELLKSLAIRIQQKDKWGQNSSFGHLMEFYSKSKPDSALWYGQRMLQVAVSLPSPDDELYALQNLALLVRPEAAKKYFLRYETLNDSLETKRKAAKNQFAVIRYNVEKARTENLELQRKNTERRYQLIAVLVAAGLGAIISIWFYQKRRQRLRLEAEKEIRESRLQLSQKVHDQVANGIYSILSEVEHSKELDKTTLINKLDSVYEVSRNIAHDEPGEDGDFTKRINSLLNAFKRPAIRLAVSGNEPELWQRVGTDAKQQLELVLQELMVNMSKHSQASQAHVSFAAEKGFLKIECRDNGVGMSNPGQSGKGLKNTVSRIKRLNGSVTFDTKAATDQDMANLSLRITLEDLQLPRPQYAYYCDHALTMITTALRDGYPYDLLVDGTTKQLPDGMGLIKSAKQLQPGLKVLVFSTESRQAAIRRLYDDFNIDGFVRKARGDAQELKTAIEQIAKNRRYYPRDYRIVATQDNQHAFTTYDKTIIRLLADGHAQKDIPVWLENNGIRPSGLSSVEKRLNLIKTAMDKNAPTDHHVVIVNGSSVGGKFNTQREAKDYACNQGYRPVHVARERHLQNRDIPDHWRKDPC